MKSAAPQLGETEVRKVLGSFLFSGDDVDKPAGVLSGGEKTRLSLALLVVSSANVLLLDEPTNNLDPASRAEILGALRTYKGAVVLVTPTRGRRRPRARADPAAARRCRDLWARTTRTLSPSPDKVAVRVRNRRAVAVVDLVCR